MKRAAQKGFTLIEMMMVVVIMGLTALLAAPAITSAIQNVKLSAAAGKMLADIRYARELALSRHATYGIEVDTANNLYKIFSLSGGIKTVITNPQTQKTMTVDLDLLPEYSGVTLSAADLCEGNGCPSVDLRFNSFGAPQDSSGTAMASTATITLSSGSATKTVNILQETGFCEAV